MGRRGLIALLAMTGALAAPAAASATTRYAAPGGTAADTVCVSPDAPKCSIGAAAGGPDVQVTDEAVILPGSYGVSDLNGDAGNPSDGVTQPTAATVHGQAGQPRPVITLESDNFYGAFLIGLGTTTVSHVEIDSAVATSNITIQAGTVEDVIARSSKGNAIVCSHTPGTTQALIRNSACLSSGSGASAVGASVATFAGTHPALLRNVTAVSTGNGSFGLHYNIFGQGVVFNVSAKSVIARGSGTDVRATGLSLSPSTPNTGAATTVILDHSNYATTSTATDAGGGSASVTAAGSGTNQILAPLLAADGYHEFAGSPTINAGATDGSSGTQDIDGQNRQIGPAPDIGADELAVGTTTSVGCTPSTVLIGAAATCTATVSAPSESISGTVSFGSGSAGAFGPGSCALPPGTTSTQCQVTYTPSQLGTHQITASYSGDANHDSSHGGSSLGVVVAPKKQKKCKKKKHRAASVAKKKCKKKRR